MDSGIAESYYEKKQKTISDQIKGNQQENWNVKTD
jgi:hypothetical protein